MLSCPFTYPCTSALLNGTKPAALNGETCLCHGDRVRVIHRDGTMETLTSGKRYVNSGQVPLTQPVGDLDLYLVSGMTPWEGGVYLADRGMHSLFRYDEASGL